MISLLFQLPESEESERRPIISLWQPWASWVIWGWKSIETRTHTRFASLEGQRIGIHAAKHFDKGALGLAEEYLFPRVPKFIIKLGDLPRGAVLGTVFVEEHRSLAAEDSGPALIDCANVQRFGLILSHPNAYPEPIAMRGRQGIWHEEIP